MTKQSSKSGIHTAENDKIIVVRHVSYEDVRKVLSDFCSSYNAERIQARLRVTKLSDGEFAITFPVDIDFETFCYLVNYLNYPVDVRWKPEVIGWTAILKNSGVIVEAITFVLPGDEEDDNVYVTTSDDIGYKHGFAVGEQMQVLSTPARPYISKIVDPSMLVGSPHEGFQ